MSPQQPHDQDAWRRFAQRFLLILEAMLADLLGHMAAEAASLPRWHPKRLAIHAQVDPR